MRNLSRVPFVPNSVQQFCGSAKCEVDRMDGSWDTRRTYRQTDRLRFLCFRVRSDFVSRLVGWHFWLLAKCLNYLMDCREIWHRYPGCSEHEFYWLWWSSDSSSALRLTFSVKCLNNIHVPPQDILVFHWILIEQWQTNWDFSWPPPT